MARFICAKASPDSYFAPVSNMDFISAHGFITRKGQEVLARCGA
jgi:hypothetical protein